MNTYKNWKKNLGKPDWYGMYSESEKWEDERNVSLPYKAAIYYTILRQTMATQE